MLSMKYKDLLSSVTVPVRARIASLGKNLLVISFISYSPREGANCIFTVATEIDKNKSCYSPREGANCIFRGTSAMNLAMASYSPREGANCILHTF